MKLPVFKALGASLSYIGAHFFTLIKILWLPSLLLTGAMAYVMPTVMDAQMQLIAVEETGDPADVLAVLGPIFKSSGLMYLAAAIFYPMIMAGVLKHVIRGDAPRLPFYLQYGGDELRLLLAYILIIIISVVAVIAGFLGFGVLSAVLGIALGAVSPEAAGIVIFLLGLVAMVAAIWFALRLSLVFPAAIGARSVGVGETWQATEGSTFGLFFYWLIWLIFMAVLMTPIGLLVAGGFLSVFTDILTAAIADPSSADRLSEEFERRIFEAQAEMWDRSSPGFWMMMLGSWLSLIVQYGLTSVAGGVAWRYLTGEERG